MTTVRIPTSLDDLKTGIATASIDVAKTFAIKAVKQEAKRLICDLEGGEDIRWRMTRAAEEDALEMSTIAPGANPRVNALILAKNNIRQRSNLAETAINELTEYSAIIGFDFKGAFIPDTPENE